MLMTEGLERARYAYERVIDNRVWRHTEGFEKLLEGVIKSCDCWDEPFRLRF